MEQAEAAQRAWRKCQCPAFMELLPFLEAKAWPVDSRLLAGLPLSFSGDFEWRAPAQPAVRPSAGPGCSSPSSSLCRAELWVC